MILKLVLADRNGKYTPSNVRYTPGVTPKPKMGKRQKAVWQHFPGWHKSSHIFIPVHLEDEFHWAAVIAAFSRRLLICYDSLHKQVLVPFVHVLLAMGY